MRQTFIATLFLAIAPGASLAQISAEGALFFDRGHYWIELAFHDAAGRDTVPPDLAPRTFEITKLEEASESFRPSRVEVVSAGDGGAVLILSSGKLEGRSCYRVTYRAESSGPISIDSICDPFYVSPGTGGCGGKAFFRNYIAPAFRKDGDAYNLNQFKYEYDFSDEKPSAAIVLEPRFKTHGLAFEPLFEQSTVAYALGRSGRTPTAKRSIGLAVSKASWVKDLRLGVSVNCRNDRSAFELAAGDSVVHAQSLAVEGRIGFDNLFDRVNRYCLSVFKGVDLGFGCAWYRSGGAPDASKLDRTAPFMNLRATWTFLYGFQLSYSLLSFWPASIGDQFTEFHSVRFRLLLRDALPPQAGHAYHPDVELAYDTGKRLPLFEKEEKASIAFTFALYPW